MRRNIPMETILDGLISDWVINRVHTATPGIVTAWDGGHKVSVQPALKIKREGGDPMALPELMDVPLIYPGGNGFRLTFPIAVGDTVLLIFSERAIETWLDSGDVVDPASSRAFDLSDAIAIPGLIPYSGAGAIPAGVTLTYGSAVVALGDDGVVSINGHLEVTP